MVRRAWKIVYHVDPDETEPARVFINSLSPKMQGKVAKFINEFLKPLDPSKLGHSRPQIGVLRNEIYELVVNRSHERVRLFFKILHKHEAILITHGFDKHCRATPPEEIESAIKRVVYTEGRIAKGEIEI